MSSFFKIEKQNISKGKFDIFEDLILLFDFLYFDIEILHLFSLSFFDYEYLTITITKIRIYFDLLLQRLFLCWFFLKQQD